MASLNPNSWGGPVMGSSPVGECGSGFGSETRGVGESCGGEGSRDGGSKFPVNLHLMRRESDSYSSSSLSREQVRSSVLRLDHF